jgi:hypothetical protein
MSCTERTASPSSRATSSVVQTPSLAFFDGKTADMQHILPFLFFSAPLLVH